MNNIKNYLKESRTKEVDDLITQLILELQKEGLNVEFGKIGIRTTYALIHNEDNSIEIVGYTFLKDMKFYKENVGRLKALQQALARKKLTEDPN
jgi:hypothetical protein